MSERIDTGCEHVIVTVDDGVATCTIERPKVNALSEAVQDAIGTVADLLETRDDVAAVVLTGSGRAFAAGVDIGELKEHTGSTMAARGPQMNACFDKLAALGKPVVAAVNGFALGGGCELALCADIRIASTNAVFGQPEVALGLIPGLGGTQRLARLIGASRAKDLIFTGRQVKADEALAIGLANEVVEPEQLMERANAWARQFVGGPAVALREAKQCINRGVEEPLADGLRREQEAFARLFDTEDMKIGVTSFLENGPGKATFVGR